jgi:hypothetical protein
MLNAITKTIIRASILLNVLFIAALVIAVYGADVKLSYHMTAGNDAMAATEQQADARVALSQVMADKDMNAIKTPAHKPKVPQ